MAIENLKLKNISVFKELDITFNKGINIFMGENGTGKTHIMKLMYAISQERDNFWSILKKGKKELAEEAGIDEQDFHNRLRKKNVKLESLFTSGFYVLEYFSSNNYDYANLVRNKEKKDIISKFDNGENELIDNEICLKLDSEKYKISLHSKNIFIVNNIELVNENLKEEYVFIPAKDILSHSKGFTSIYNYREIPFDKTYYDIVIKSQKGYLKKLDSEMNFCLSKLSEIIGGEVQLIGEQFYIKKANNLNIEFNYEAEGVRKLALLWVLIRNGSIKRGSVLFWDEPESNVNPKVIKVIADILVQLSKLGVQIFISTHNYFVMQELSLYSEYKARKENIGVNFISLYRNDTGDVNFEIGKNISELQHNVIMNEFNNLYNREQDLFYED